MVNLKIRDFVDSTERSSINIILLNKILLTVKNLNIFKTINIRNSLLGPIISNIWLVILNVLQFEIAKKISSMGIADIRSAIKEVFK